MVYRHEGNVPKCTLSFCNSINRIQVYTHKKKNNNTIVMCIREPWIKRQWSSNPPLYPVNVSWTDTSFFQIWSTIATLSCRFRRLLLRREEERSKKINIHQQEHYGSCKRKRCVKCMILWSIVVKTSKLQQSW